VGLDFAPLLSSSNMLDFLPKGPPTNAIATTQWLAEQSNDQDNNRGQFHGSTLQVVQLASSKHTHSLFGSQHGGCKP